MQTRVILVLLVGALVGCLAKDPVETIPMYPEAQKEDPIPNEPQAPAAISKRWASCPPTQQLTYRFIVLKLLALGVLKQPCVIGIYPFGKVPRGISNPNITCIVPNLQWKPICLKCPAKPIIYNIAGVAQLVLRNYRCWPRKCARNGKMSGDCRMIYANKKLFIRFLWDPTRKIWICVAVIIRYPWHCQCCVPWKWWKNLSG